MASTTCIRVMWYMGTSKEYVTILDIFHLALTLRQQNVLVDELGHARLADFGFSIVTRNLDSVQGDSEHHGFTPRWAAPEVLKHWSHSKESDTFSFGMVMYEVCHQ